MYSSFQPQVADAYQFAYSAMEAHCWKLSHFCNVKTGFEELTALKDYMQKKKERKKQKKKNQVHGFGSYAAKLENEDVALLSWSWVARACLSI